MFSGESKLRLLHYKLRIIIFVCNTCNFTVDEILMGDKFLMPPQLASLRMLIAGSGRISREQGELNIQFKKSMVISFDFFT